MLYDGLPAVAHRAAQSLSPHDYLLAKYETLAELTNEGAGLSGDEGAWFVVPDVFMLQPPGSCLV